MHKKAARKKKPNNRRATTRPKTTGRALTARQIFSASKNAKLRVDVPEWGGHVFVRAVRQSEFNELVEALGDDDSDLNEKFAKFVILVTCDEDGERIFTKSQHKNVIELGVPGMMRVMRAGMEFNNLGDDDVDELVGKSRGTPSSSSD